MIRNLSEKKNMNENSNYPKNLIIKKNVNSSLNNPLKFDFIFEKNHQNILFENFFERVFNEMEIFIKAFLFCNIDKMFKSLTFNNSLFNKIFKNEEVINNDYDNCLTEYYKFNTNFKTRKSLLNNVFFFFN